jgi:hypothetical protein
MADRKDEGGGGEPLDKVLSKLDELGTRMDALEVKGGSKNPLKADKGRKDEDEKPFPPKADKKSDEFPPPKEKDDDDEDEDKDKKDDEFPPPKDKDEDEPDKKPPPLAADKKKDAKKDAAPPPPPVADKKKDDDEDEDDKKEEKDDAKADSVNALKRQLANQDREIARLAALMKPRSDDEHAAFADVQAKADSVFAGFGKRAPRPLEGESLIRYRKRMATELKPYSSRWQKVKFSQLPDEAFSVAEEMVYADAMEAAANPTDLGDGELREVQRTDPRTGLKTIVFYGKDSFVKSMGRPARRVASFRTQSAV